MRGHLIQLRGYQPAKPERRDDADRESAYDGHHSLPNDKVENIIRLGDFARPHIAHTGNDLARNARAADELCLSERIFVAKNFLRPSLADDDNVLTIRWIVLMKIAAGEKRNAPCLEVVWRDVVTDGCGAFIYRQNLAFSPRVKEVADRGG